MRRIANSGELYKSRDRQGVVAWLTEEGVREQIRAEALAPFCWLCQDPQVLRLPLRMKGNQGIYPLDHKVGRQDGLGRPRGGYNI